MQEKKPRRSLEVGLRNERDKSRFLNMPGREREKVAGGGWEGGKQRGSGAHRGLFGIILH